MSTVASGLPPRFDVLDPALLRDPYPTYARLRRDGALCRAGPGTWAITRYAEVAALLRDPRLGHGHAEDGGATPLLPDTIRPNPELPRLVSGLDPPEHTRIRRLMSKALSPTVIAGLRARIAREADRLVAGAVERGQLDAVGDLALPLQTAIVCDLLGVPDADREEVCRQAAELGRAIILIPFVTEERGNGQAEASWLRAYVAGLVAERRRTPGDDLISQLLGARHGGRSLGADELVDNAVFLFFAGFETSIHTVAGGCAALGRFPDQFTRLREERSLVPGAVEEILRLDAPLQWISRTTTAPVEVAGRTVKPGRLVLLLLASANRDERQFAAHDRLNVGRHPNPHLSFGGGVHHCLGVGLARAQAAIVLDRLATRCGMLEPAGPPVVRPHPNVRGYVRVPIAVEPA